MAGRDADLELDSEPGERDRPGRSSRRPADCLNCADAFGETPKAAGEDARAPGKETGT